MRRWEPSSRTVAAVSQRSGSSLGGDYSQAVEGVAGQKLANVELMRELEKLRFKNLKEIQNYKTKKHQISK